MPIVSLVNCQYSDGIRKYELWKNLDIFSLPKPKQCRLTKSQVIELLKKK